MRGSGWILLYTFWVLGAGALQGQTPGIAHQSSTLGGAVWTPIDTAFALDPFYRQEPLLDDWFGYIPLGNQGSPRQSLLWQDRQRIGAHFGHPGLDLRFRDPKDWKTYQVKAPLSEADYRHGYGRGQSFHIFFTQNVNERWNYLVDFTRLNSFGRYVRQQVQQSDLVFTTRYASSDSTYVLKMGFNTGLIENQASGGIAFDTVFTLGTLGDEELVPVNDSNATQFSRNRRLYFDQAYQPFAKPDTARKKTWYSGFGLRHEFDYWRQSYVLIDGPDGDQSPPLLQENATIDSTAFERVRNGLSIISGGKLGMEVGLWSEVYRYEGVNHSKVGTHTALVGKIDAKVLRNIPFRAQAELIFQGERAGDVHIRVETGFERATFAFLPYAELERSQPGMIYQRYTSNYRAWNRLFDPQTRTEFGVRLIQPFFGQLRLRALVLDAPVYFSETVDPIQSNEALTYIGLNWKARYQIVPWLYMGTDLQVQSQAGVTDYITLPGWLGRLSVNGQFRLFNRSLEMQPGFSVWAFDRYSMMAYQYEMEVFTHQDNAQLGGYPWLDVFVNFKLQEATFFFELEHLNALWSERNYWAAPGYPLNGFAFRTGIRWRFFD
ncbi:hypothetical protein GC167_05835 [bacterium]|nr:hypothetical protein [bacterium]